MSEQQENKNSKATYTIAQVRVTDVDLIAWRAAAKIADRPLASFVRACVNAHSDVIAAKLAQATSKAKASMPAPAPAKWVHPTELLQEKPIAGALVY